MARPFNIGDIVRLKSGGPAMTVTDVDLNDDDGTYWVSCTWFDEKGQRASSSFPAATVETVEAV